MNHQKYSLWSFLKPQLFVYSFGIVGDCAVTASLIVLQAFAWKDLFDASVTLSGDLLIRSSLFFLVPIILLVTISPIFYYLYQRSVKKIMNSIMLATFRKINCMPSDYLQQHHSGNLLSLFNNDIRAIETLFTSQIKAIVFHIIISLSSIISMLLLNWKIGLFLISIGVLSAIVISFYSKQLRSISDSIQRRLAVRTARLLDIIAGVNVIKMFNLSSIVVGQFNRVNKGNVCLEVSRGKKVAKLECANYLIGFINFGGAFAVGAIMLSNGSIGLGTLTALVQLSISVSSSFLQIGGVFAQLQTSLAGSRRLEQLFLEQEDILLEKPKVISTASVSLRFNNVSFNYLNSEKQVLNNVNITFPERGMIALVGESGSGKSTIAKLLMGVHAPTAGDIYLNDVSYSNISTQEIREEISFVPQNAFLFNGSIEENIRLGNLEASREEIVSAAIAANAHEFIEALENGYSTEIGENGFNLSGGQRQRIALARALVRNSSIIILDEATSALDAKSEELINLAIKQLSLSKCLIVITHGLKTMLSADQIYVLDSGQIVQEGKPEQLRKVNGVFQQLISV
ncbi:ABC transporter ATP-binding protein/permease [Paenibacillus sp. MER TA 81-3]|uniref:ABC transporter ATP-binding protein n=1 Tax=Paenibacillus sp. MER TA 81-3 TaxID=2939573 RepID=UPI00203FBF24|nr:ABC transporter ATP-binding protein [Paenibacillus sp. MER TA 81-3]MCM3340703.1 ABC transporter ATP-binding protein/permease [Paenibacillus sp. MER TA 81-3]